MNLVFTCLESFETEEIDDCCRANDDESLKLNYNDSLN